MGLKWKNKWLVIVFVLLITSVFSTLLAKVPAKRKMVLLPCRPIDAGEVNKKTKNMWLVALIDRQVRFKTEIISEIKNVDDTLLLKLIPLYNYNVSLEENDFKGISQKVGATHLLLQKFELIQNNKIVNYYAEIVNLANSDIVAQVEKDIPIEKIGMGVDTCLLSLMENFVDTLSTDTRRYLLFPLTSNNLGIIKDLGEIFLKENDTSQNNLRTISSEYEKLIKKDPLMLLANFGAGMFFFRTKQYEKSSRYLKELLDMVPKYNSLFLALSASYRMEGKYTDALQIALQCEKNRWKTEPFLIEKALALEGLRQYSAAFSVHQQILMLNPSQIISLLFMARTKNDERNFTEAKNFAERAIKADPNNAEGYYELGRTFVGLGDYINAQKNLTKGEELQPENPLIQKLLGDVLIYQNKYEEAYHHYNRASALRPLDLDLFLKTAAALEYSGKKKEALELLYSIVGRFPSKPELRRQIGMLEFVNNKSDSACKSLAMYLSIKPDDGLAWQTLGMAYVKIGNLKKAKESFEKALPLVNDKIPCQLALADLEMKEKNTSKAKEILIKIVNEKPIKDAHSLLGDAYAAENRREDALKEYKKERELHGEDSVLQEKIAVLSYEMGVFSAAKKEFELLVKISPQHRTAFYYLALISLRSGNVEEATELLNRAEKISPAPYGIYFEAGNLFRDRNVLDKAIKAYQRCITIKPDYEDALVNLADLYLKIGKDTSAASVNITLFKIDNKKYFSRMAQAGHLYKKNGMDSLAAVIYKTFLEKGFRDFSVNASYSELLYKKKDYQKVIELLKDISDEYASNIDLLLMLADAYCQKEQYEKALPWLKRIRQIKENISKEAFLSAIASEKTGDTISAIAHYKRLIGMVSGKEKIDNAYHLGTLYEAKKMIENAITLYENNIKEFPDDLRSYERVAAIYIKRTEWQNAKRVLEKAITYPEAKPIIQKMLAQTYAGLNLKDKAAELYSLYITKEKKDVEAWKELSSIYYSQKKYKEAIEPLKQVTSLEPSNFEGWYRLGDSYLQTENFTAAVEPLGRARTLDPKSIPAIELSAKCYRNLKETSTLATILREWIVLDPKRYDIKMEIGALLLEEKRVDEAIVMLNEAAKFLPMEAEPHLLLAKAYKFQGKDSLQLKCLSNALKFAPDNWEIHYEMARYYLAKRLGYDAEQHFIKAITLNSTNARIYYEYAVLLISRGDFNSANSQLKLALERESKNPLYLVTFAYTESMIGNINNALKIASSPTVNSSNDPHVIYWIGMVYKQCGVMESAAENFKRAISTDSSCANCFEGLGDVYMGQYRFKEAANSYFTSWEKGGYNFERVYKLGNALLYDRKFVEAKDFFETILSKNTKADDARYRLVVAYCELGDLKSARSMISKFQVDGTPWMQLAQGKIYEKEGNLEAAVTAYKIAQRLDSDNPEVAMGLGNIYLKQKKYDSALIYFSLTSAADTLNVVAMIKMGEVFEGLGDLSSAIQYYMEVDRKYPQYPDVQVRIAKIKSSQNAHETALRYLERGLQYNSEDTTLYLMAGKESFLVDDYKKALEYFKKALKIGKGKPIDALKYIGDIYYDKLSDVKKAKEYYKKYVKEGGNDKEILERVEGI